MTTYYKKPLRVEATQWFKNGDHPLDDCWRRDGGKEYLVEGKIVRYYRSPDNTGKDVCEDCGNIMHAHGWIDNCPIMYQYIVCPGDFVVSGVYWGNVCGSARIYFPQKPEEFLENHMTEQEKLSQGLKDE